MLLASYLMLNPCIVTSADNYQTYEHKSNSLGCTAQDVKFNSLSSFEVHDPLAETCNCHGLNGTDCTGEEGAQVLVDGVLVDEVSCLVEDGSAGGRRLPSGSVIGACLGIDDNVIVTLAFNIDVSAERYDIGMYIGEFGKIVRSFQRRFVFAHMI